MRWYPIKKHDLPGITPGSSVIVSVSQRRRCRFTAGAAEIFNCCRSSYRLYAKVIFVQCQNPKKWYYMKLSLFIRHFSNWFQADSTEPIQNDWSRRAFRRRFAAWSFRRFSADPGIAGGGAGADPAMIWAMSWGYAVGCAWYICVPCSVAFWGA